MTSRHRLSSSLITTKLIIGATGILLFLYLILHIVGNLLVFLGQDTFNKCHITTGIGLVGTGLASRTAPLPGEHLLLSRGGYRNREPDAAPES